MINRIEYLFRLDKDILSSYIVVGLGFFITISVAVTNILFALLVLIFILEKDYRRRFDRIKSNPIIYIVFSFVLMHFIGYFWTADSVLAVETLGRIKKLLWIPFLMIFVKKEHIMYYFQAFVLGVMVSEILTYLVWLEILPHFMYSHGNYPSPLMNSVNYAPFLAMGVFLLMYFFLYREPKSKMQYIVIIFFISTMLFNLFISGGRAGQLGFLILFFILIVDFYRKNIIKGLVIFSIMSVVIFSLAYQNIPFFKERIDFGIKESQNFSPGEQKSSVSVRLALIKNYYEIVKENPWLGVGTGGYLSEYELINKKSEYQTMITHPHNTYMLVFVQLGVIGGGLFLSLFLYQLYYGFKTYDKLRVLRIAFPSFFLGIMLTNWYLYTFSTMMLFIFFSAILYYRYDSKILLED